MYKEEKRNTANFNNGQKVYNNDAGKNDNNVAKKPLRYNEDDLNKSLLNKTLKITLINNQVISGILVNLGVYDLTIKRKITEKFGEAFRETEKNIIVMKAVICTVEMQ